MAGLNGFFVKPTVRELTLFTFRRDGFWGFSGVVVGLCAIEDVHCLSFGAFIIQSTSEILFEKVSFAAGCRTFCMNHSRIKI